MGAPEFLTQPANKIYAVTQHDTTADPNGPFRAILLSVAGAVSLTTRGGTTVTIPSGGLSPGVLHPIRVRNIRSSGTTATGIFGVKDETVNP